MEFPELGKHCSVPECKKLDFLPFQCTGCKKTFCLEHRSFDAHKCSTFENAGVALVCPLCASPIALRPGEDANRKVEEHIQSGCPKSTTNVPKPHVCTVPRCGKTELFPVLCSRCKHHFCLSHRHPADHQCSVAPPPTEVVPARKPIPALVQKRLDEYKSSQAKRTAAQVAQIKNRTNAKGDSRIPPQKRFYLEVVFPSDSHIHPQNMYFNREWVVGRVIDVAADLVGLINNNNKAGADRLTLVSLKTGEPLPVDIPLQELAQGTEPLVKSGDAVLLERLPATSAT